MLIRQKVMLAKYTSGYFRKKEDVQETKLSTEEGTEEFLGGCLRRKKLSSLQVEREEM